MKLVIEEREPTKQEWKCGDFFILSSEPNRKLRYIAHSTEGYYIRSFEEDEGSMKFKLFTSTIRSLINQYSVGKHMVKVEITQISVVEV